MKFHEFKNTLNKPYFSSLDISLRGLTVYPSQLSLWKKQGKIQFLKRGLYCFSERKNELQREQVAFLLCNPSYVSMESALSYYGFIPEMVFSTTLVTPKINRKFSNDFGTFLYRHLKSDLFFGYVVQQRGAEGKSLMAEPEKAILDYFYLNLGRIQDRDDIEGLRLNYDEIAEKIDYEQFLRYRRQFHIAKLDRVTDIVLTLCLPSNK